MPHNLSKARPQTMDYKRVLVFGAHPDESDSFGQDEFVFRINTRRDFDPVSRINRLQGGFDGREISRDGKCLGLGA